MAHQKADDGAIEEEASDGSENEDFVQSSRLKPRTTQKTKPGPKLSSD